MSIFSKLFGSHTPAIANTAFERRSLQAAQSEVKQLRETVNRYEASIPSNPDRSWVPAFVRDARYDANSFTRWELTRKIRYFRRNVWLVQRLEEEFTKWTVGPNGLQVIPNSSDDDWNKRMSESYAAWCESPCLDSTITMSQVHRLMAREFHIDGELFINKTRRKDAGKQSIPAIQLIESHRCSSPGTEWSYSTSDQNIIDGVQLGPDSKPSGYWVRDGVDGEARVFRSTSDMHHVFDPTRIGMFRDLTPYHAVINDLNDMADLEQMEMQKAKQNSEISNILTNPAGELNPNMLRQQRGLPSATPSANPNEADIQKRLEMYRRVIGSRTIALKTGEVLNQFDSKTPSAATQWYWRYKIGQICTAANIPLIIVFPELIGNDIQGTLVRGIYDNAHEFFRSKFFVLAHSARDMYRFYAQWARYNVPALADAPSDWNKCHVIPPRAVNVDIGYNSAATLAELEAGITNWDDIAGRYGTTAEVLIRKKAKNVAAIHRIAIDEGVEPSEISAPIADVVQKLAMAQQAEALADQATSQSKEPVNT